MAVTRSLRMMTFFLSLSAFSVFAQMSTRPSPQEIQSDWMKGFDKFNERLKINYFGVFTSPNFEEMNKGNWKNAALSPEFSGGSNKDSWPTNLWHQLSFNYNFGAKMNFVFNPRFMTPLAYAQDMGSIEDKSLLMVEDFLFGFQGVVYTSSDKAFNLWIRPGLRLPTSRTSRNSGQSGAGTLSHQLELAYNMTYDFNKTWQLGVFGQLRSWIIEDHYAFDRFRIYTAPFIQYKLNDSHSFSVYYENMLETNQRSLPAHDRDILFKDVWQNLFFAYSTNLTKKLNVMPFVSAFVNDVPFSTQSMWFGAWISYQIK